MSESEETAPVFGQASWRLATRNVEAYLTRLGGHLGPISFHVGGRTIKPYALCPWAEEALPEEVPPLLRVLRGDFFCMPFGANDTPFKDERHPPHGETANGHWNLVSIRRENDIVTLQASLDTSVRSGRVEKQISLREGHSAVYSRHRVSGMSGPMSLGHHAMLRFPDAPGSGIITTSPFVYAQTAPLPVERPEDQGYSFLQPDASFTSLDSVPTITGERTDLSRYPARKGFEDLVLLVSDSSADFAWTAVTFPKERYVWFALKDPSILNQTIFWISNGGRYYPPWNGRHTGVMGLEEVTSFFHYGLAQSAESNPLENRGIATCLHLNAAEPLDVRYIMAVAEIPEGFDQVKEIEAGADRQEVILRSVSKIEVNAALDVSFLQTMQQHGKT